MQVKLPDGPDAYAPDNVDPVVSRTKDTHTTNRVVRLGTEWDELADATGKRGRAAVIRQLVQWYLRYPGAKLPERPVRRAPAE
jgi:hypothetical protein